MDENYVIEGDGDCLKLVKKTIISDDPSRGAKPKPENIGKTREVVEAFYGSLDQACEGYLHRVVGGKGTATAQEIITTMALCLQRIHEICVPINKLVKEKAP
jgi:hypothetical protein